MNKRISENIVKNKGFSLIEILVSLVVLSVGLMGLGGLQLAALKGSNEAHYRTEASLLMMDLSDRMRANIDGVGDGKYLIKPSSPINCYNAPAKQCDTASCDSTQLAEFDKYTIYCGKNGVKALLPSGELSVNCVDNNCNAIVVQDNTILNKTHNITISWQEAKKKDEDVSDGKIYKVKSIDVSIVP